MHRPAGTARRPGRVTVPGSGSAGPGGAMRLTGAPRAVGGLAALAGLALVGLLAGCVAGQPVGGRPAPSPPVGSADGGADLDRLDATVRVAVARHARTVELRGHDLLARDAAGELGPVAGRPGEGRLVVAAGAGEVVLDGRPAGTGHLVVVGGGVIEAVVDGGAGRRHRGRLEVVAEADGLLLVNELPLERYLAGVVGLEMDPGWPPEALKAQAVAARTYALHRRLARRRAAASELDRARYDLEAGVLDQVYGGADGEDPRAVEAVAATRGEWLAGPDGEPIFAAFHSTAGGYTESAAEVWGRPLPYLVAHACPYDRDSPVFTWRWTVPVEEVERRLVAAGYPVAGLRRLEVAGRTASGRARSVRAAAAGGSVTLPAVELRRLLGYGRLRSTGFEVDRDGDAFRFDGRGAGHGVGLCQWGARGMALGGRGYRAILDFYYPRSRLATSVRSVAPARGEAVVSAGWR